MTTPERNPEEIFCKAIEITDAAERAAFLDEACGTDRELRARVEALLRAHERAGDFLSPPAGACATLDGPASIEGPGTTIGRYELLDLLGEGGMGLVYLAEQKEPVRRKVALKIIKPGMDSRQIVARFEAERQALALLDHPNIAHVFDAGCTETGSPAGAGRPYFVMEYVKGLPITSYCDQNKLTIEQRLRLFEQVCEAVHHAHQKGIIHRDLKPSNILVSVHSDRATPKIIDFGIAKAITSPLTDKTYVTFQGQLLGTPEYMSPEQVDLATQDIDTRSDIYSLGIVLYELLAGVLPFESESFAKAGLAEIQQTIREQEPASPSIRLTNLGERAHTIAASRGTQAVPLARRLHRELEWIPLKAMRKDRCRRYKSASEMADDIRNYLNGNPLLAGPETTIYRVQKFVRRHAGSVTTAALVAAAIILALVVSTAMYFRSERSLRREAVARTQAEQARQQEASAHTEAEAAREKEAQARVQAETAEAATKQKAEELRRTLYVNSIQLADAKHREGNAKQVRTLLDSCPENLRAWEWNRLNYIQDQSIRTLRVHHESVCTAVFTPDGRQIITGGDDKTIRVWDSASGEELQVLRGHEDGVCSLAISPDGRYVVSGGDEDDKTVRLWNLEAKAEVATLRGHRDWVTCVAFSPDGKRVISGSGDNTIKLWDARTGAELITLRAHRECVNSVAFSPDGKRIVSASDDETIRVYDSPSGTEVRTIVAAHKGFTWCARFSPDGERIVSGGRDGSIKVWDAKPGDGPTNITGHDGPVSSVTFSPDGQLIASGGWDNAVKVWDAQTGEELRTFRGHDWLVCSVSFSPDGKQLMSAGQDDTVKLWDVMIGHESTKIHAHATRARIAFSSDGKRIASVGVEDRTARIWDAATGTELMTLGHENMLSSIAFSPDDRRIALGDSEHSVVRIRDASTGAELMALRGHKGAVRCIAFSPDGRYIASGSLDKTIKLWDAESGAEVKTLQGHDDGVPSLAFNPDGKRIVSGSWDKTTRVWDLASGTELMTLRGHDGQVYSVAFSPDGTLVASASADRTAKVWDAATGAELMTLGHTDMVSCMAFSPDGRRIVTGERLGGVKLWDSTTGAELLTLRIELRTDEGVSAVAFSPDGKTVAASTKTGQLMLWESTGPTSGYEPQRNGEIARRLVEKLYAKSGSYRDVVSQLQNSETLDADVRTMAIQTANSRGWEDGDKLRKEASEIVDAPDRDLAAYRTALEKIEKAGALEPNDLAIVTTLGAVQYRLELYEDALRTLTKPAQVLSGAGEDPDPVNIAFTAMVLQRVGRIEEAKAALKQLRELCKSDAYLAWDMEVQALLAEAEGLILGQGR